MRRFLRIASIAIAIVVAFMLVRFAMLGHASRSGEAPGRVSGQLAPCPDRPNCVCSEVVDDAAHQVAPLDLAGVPPEKAWADLQRVVEELGGTIAVADDGYIAATFSSALFGFVDDVEFRLDASQQKIQIRSASRVGYSDMGVNRKRVEALTRSFDRATRGDGRGGA